MVCGNCKQEGHTILKCIAPCRRCSKSITDVKLNLHMKVCRYDIYTEDFLRIEYAAFKEYMLNCKNRYNKANMPCRLPNPPEHITENIVKFILRNIVGDKTVVWCKAIDVSGDLNSLTYGVIEVKAFTSDGPSSFGPTKKFSIIYFLDMRQWLDNIIILHSINVTNESEEWKKLKVTISKTFEEKVNSEESHRPHISFENILKSIPADKVKTVYKGTFEGIFVPVNTMAVDV